ncbi:NAD(P)H-dependent glycerol-3-phosphate dehydrogenase [Sphingobacterium wenxiniae]|uniref:Glycerol-3-phosphate dehydrogenase n=1 Tax=Sphingobacterium wenxiniae TaxID=683125 RepID=A0A1I6VTF1_9SPHI|nr:NAD(P)H-dependent glycerol-3-phosphate dehydrogenase [Sphingobacterium wenxiniae]SFT16949.1 glycerol 3-phosphate dehydrogenase (NAD(P)+) [Sphingobacterium wenxiniae]
MKEISVIGGGSWATALVKILTENKVHVHWYVRRHQQADILNQKGVNPDYLQGTKLDATYIEASTDLEAVISKSEILLFLVPSAQLPAIVRNIDTDLLKEKFVITSIKGTVGENNDLPSAFISQTFHLGEQHQAMIGGPCHAEEIAGNRKTYMTLCSANLPFLRRIADWFTTPYVRVQLSADLLGVEYAAIYKNVVGIVCGMAKGLNYGDNFMAVLVSNAIYELEVLLSGVGASTNRMGCSQYLGDLLVTGYSAHSRNRTFGELIGQGYSVVQSQTIMSMVAEGYYATKGLFETASRFGLNLPLLNTAYRVLYNHMPVVSEFKLLERNIK